MLHAVAVGIDRYTDDAIPDLSFAAADAKAVADLLSSRLVPDERSVRLLLNEDATRRKIMHAVGEDLTRSVQDDDIVVIYFAGHGCPERVGPKDKPARYLLTHDTEYSMVYGTALGLETHIPEWLDRLESARLVTIILDCCFSGAAGGRSVEGPLLRLAGLRTRGASLVSLKQLDLGRGRVILCASDDDQLAHESPEAGHGLFTDQLLQALTKPGATEKVVLLTQLYNDVASAVRRRTNDAQQPVMTLLRNNMAALPSLAESDGQS